jgi:hypothetical protein
MAGQTTNGLPYPQSGDNIDVPADIQALAQAIESNFITENIVDAKGDLIVATASNTVTKVSLGTNGYVLTADSSESSGVKWAVPSAGSFDPILFLGV